MTRRSFLVVRLACVAFGLLAIGTGLWHLIAARAAVEITAVSINGTPARIYKLPATDKAPVMLIAHGFAGSQQLMQSFALTFARNGLIAVTFDFLGHGRNPQPLTGSITEPTGATRALIDETAKVAAYARAIGNGRMAVLGHSMASDIVVRFADNAPEVEATIAVSMFSPVVTATSPRNLLVIVGDWEGMLKTEALRAVGLATAPAQAEPGVTYGDLSKGTGRRTAFSAHVEHASVLFSQDSMREAQAWVDQTFGIDRAAAPILDDGGPWILLLILGVIVLAYPLSSLLPVVSSPAAGAGLRWRSLWLPMLLPMLATPLILRLVPTHFLPVLVGDYLAAHFALYGILSAICLVVVRRRQAQGKVVTVDRNALILSTLAAILFGFIALVWPIDRFVTSFLPGPERVLLVLAMLAGTLCFFLADEWLTRGEAAARGAYAATKLAFLISLGIAVALDFERLFFLIIIIPVIIPFFLVYGLLSRWIYRRTGHPFVAAFANAVAFAWAIGVTFPLLAG